MERPFVTIATPDQWLRCTFSNTSLEEGVVTLAAMPEELTEAIQADEIPLSAGLAFDAQCRLFHSVPERGQVERLFWRMSDRLRPPGTPPEARDLFAPARSPIEGDFQATAPIPPMGEPRGLAVDGEDRLWVTDSLSRMIRVFDLRSERLIASLPMPSPPLDLAGSRNSMMILCAACLVEATLHRILRETALDGELAGATRIARAPNNRGLWLLLDGGLASARIVSHDGPAGAFAEPYATDLEFDASGVMTVARSPESTFTRYSFVGGTRAAIAPLLGRGYDGRGIVLTPDGRIGFWSALGFRTAVSARRRYLSKGRVVTHRLDSGEFNTRWGRVFVDACVPAGTLVSLHAIVADEPPPDPAIARIAPLNIASVNVIRPDQSPPMPPESTMPSDEESGHSLHRRETGREIPWTEETDERFATYEAPILPKEGSEEGRYLWIVADLAGNSRTTPKIRAIRAEHPSHQLLAKLPKIYSRERTAESFLWRYLAPIEGMLGEWDTKGERRHVLLDSRSAPAEMLPWLASFTGLVLDGRWSERAKRQAIAEAIWLFRFRGTVPGLMRFLEIYLGFPVRIVEQYRLRGHGGGTVGAAAVSSSILGGGFRVGGAVGADDAVATGASKLDDGFVTSAHRFTVFLPGWLSAEQTAVIRDLLEVHRPAHTLYELCSLGTGMRVGRGLYVELTSMVGASAAWSTWQVGSTPLGREAILGRPSLGMPVGSALDGKARIG